MDSKLHKRSLFIKLLYYYFHFSSHIIGATASRHYSFYKNSVISPKCHKTSRLQLSSYLERKIILIIKKSIKWCGGWLQNITSRVEIYNAIVGVSTDSVRVLISWWFLKMINIFLSHSTEGKIRICTFNHYFDQNKSYLSS